MSLHLPVALVVLGGLLASPSQQPAAQRRLQRTIDGGIGFFSCQAPFAKVGKSVHASARRSMSST